MNQRRDRCRTCHRIRQPHIQWDLRRFPRHSHQHKYCDRRDDGWHRCRYFGRFIKYFLKAEGAESPEHDKCGDQEAEVTDAVGDESLIRGGGVAGAVLAFVKPETNQQVRTQPYTLPADKQHQVIVGAHQYHHGGDKQVHVDEETLVSVRVSLETDIVVHVTSRIDMDDRTYAGHHQHHGDRQCIHLEGPRDVQVSDVDPIEQVNNHALWVTKQ